MSDEFQLLADCVPGVWMGVRVRRLLTQEPKLPAHRGPGAFHGSNPKPDVGWSFAEPDDAEEADVGV